MLAFGLPLAFTSIVEYSLLNADYVIIGQSLGATAIGLYLLAYNVSNWPIAVLTDAVRGVSIAGFSKLSGDVTVLRERFVQAFATLVTIAVPVCLGLGVLAGPVIRLVYGSKWEASIGVLTFLAVLGGVRVVIGFIFDLLVGAGRTNTTLFVSVVWLVALIPALVVGVEEDGIRGVAIAHAVVGVTVALPAFLWSLHRFGVSLHGLGRVLVRPAVGGLAACVAGVTVEAEIEDDLLSLVCAGIAVLVVYAAVVLPGSTLLRRAQPVAAEVVA
jgi:PST family polysaccharide transporter